MPIYNCKWLGRHYGMTIWPFIFYRATREDLSPWNREHEEFHWRHQLQWLVVPWFIIYGIMWLMYGNDNPWEKLAKEAESDTRNP